MTGAGNYIDLSKFLHRLDKHVLKGGGDLLLLLPKVTLLKNQGYAKIAQQHFFPRINAIIQLDKLVLA